MAFVSELQEFKPELEHRSGYFQSLLFDRSFASLHAHIIRFSSENSFADCCILNCVLGSAFVKFAASRATKEESQAQASENPPNSPDPGCGENKELSDASKAEVLMVMLAPIFEKQ